MVFFFFWAFAFLCSLANSLYIDKLTPRQVARRLSVGSLSTLLQSLDLRNCSNLENLVGLIRCERYDFVKESAGLRLDQLKLLLEQNHEKIIKELVTAGHIAENPGLWNFVLDNIQSLELPITGRHWPPINFPSRIQISVLEYMLRTQVTNISSYEWCLDLDTTELGDELLTDDLWQLYPSHCLVKMVLKDPDFLSLYIARIERLDTPLPGWVRLALLSRRLGEGNIENDYSMVEFIGLYFDGLAASSSGETLGIFESLMSMADPMESIGGLDQAVQILHPIYTQNLIGGSESQLFNIKGLREPGDATECSYISTASTFEFELAEFIFQKALDPDIQDEYARGILSRYPPSEVSPFMQNAFLQSLTGLDHYKMLRCGQWPETFSFSSYAHLSVPFIAQSEALSSWRRRIFRMPKSYNYLRIQSLKHALRYFATMVSSKTLLPLYLRIDYEGILMRPKDLALFLIESMVQKGFLQGSWEDGFKFYCDARQFSSWMLAAVYAMVTLLASGSIDEIPLSQELIETCLYVFRETDLSESYDFSLLSPNVCIQPTNIPEPIQVRFVEQLMLLMNQLLEELDMKTLAKGLGILGI